LGLINQPFAEGDQGFSQEPEKVGKPNQVMADGCQHWVLPQQIDRMIALIIAEFAMAVPANDGEIVVMLLACNVMEFHAARVCLSANSAGWLSRTEPLKGLLFAGLRIGACFRHDFSP